ncbi:hypothetical protein CERZMDRAFT_105256 [Cercospora zeae-maydis SCOH1-5]|uniref:Mid2 domain-containing protein n=1 Tax=Cercospora zeae-maydis SCOH1-5 TaxID=717836 RepID=A0A6A6FMT8_9PEZI|nr:hypothetical protein CERZMDRAFT_105256 [Cercospora zeae-maydis SCOH1-5]
MRPDILGAIFAGLTASLTLAETAQQCYYPDGTASKDVPCNATAAAVAGGYSACCSESSYCMDNGLCLDTGILKRMSCTDKTFKDKKCPQYCITDNMGDPCAVTPYAVFPVTDLKQIVLKADQLVTAMSAAGVPTSSIDPAATPTETVPILTVTATGAPKSADSNAKFTVSQLVGVGAGLGIPMLLAIGVLTYLLVAEKRRHSVREIGEGAFRPPPTMESRDGNSWSAWSETTKVGNVPTIPMFDSHRLQDLEGKSKWGQHSRKSSLATSIYRAR